MSDWIEKAKDFIKGHPDQVGQAVDKAEDIIDEKTGGRYTEQVDAGADRLREGLGLPPEADESQPVPPGEPTPSPTPTPSPPPVPTPPPGPTPEPGPATPPPGPPIDPNDPRPVDPSLPGPGPSEIPPGTGPAPEQDLPGVPDPNLPGSTTAGPDGASGGDITLDDPPRQP